MIKMDNGFGEFIYIGPDTIIAKATITMVTLDQKDNILNIHIGNRYGCSTVLMKHLSKKYTIAQIYEKLLSFKSDLESNEAVTPRSFGGIGIS